MPGIAVAAARHVRGLVTDSFHKTIAGFALITDDEGRVLMVRNAIGRRVWTLPGGRIERDERPHDGVVREVREETALEIRVERLVVVDVGRADTVMLTFRCAIVGGELRPAPGEIAAARWTTDEDLDREHERRRRVVRLARSARDGEVHYIG
ncbi:MAG: NUDIX domain-containing protein [Chloroflexota bacterium]|nr:NUDIX domain-containing protein [Chloroflexota bacterium]